MKKAIALILAVLMLLSFAACEKQPQTDAPEVLPVKEETVEYGSIVGENLLKNGDFSEGETGWATYHNGGSSAVSYAGNRAAVNISVPGPVDYGCQLYYDGFRLLKGGQYIFSFEASADAEKTIQARIQLNGGDYRAYVVENIVLTTEPQVYSLPFEMTGDSDFNPRLAFNMGTFDTDNCEYPVNITFRNISVILQNQVIEETEEGQAINLNQVGYLPADTKTVYFRGENMDEEFRVVDASGKVAFTGKITNRVVNLDAEEYTYSGDFTKLKTPGIYFVETNNYGKSFAFSIGEEVFGDALDAAFKMFYLQRCGCALDPSLAGDFAHTACHTAESRLILTDEYTDASGGWHDAGDYGRYVVPGAKSVADMLLSYRLDPEAFGDDMGIPESGNGISDILDEAKFELDWLFKMQKADGSVFHKATTLKFPAFIMPEEDTASLFVTQISSTATADFAAVMAMAAVDFADIDAAYADRCLAAARRAFDYNLANGNNSFRNSGGCETGEYPDTDDTDEMYWAACALYAATGEPQYHDYLKSGLRGDNAEDFGWQKVGGYGNLIYLFMEKSLQNSEAYKAIKQTVINGANSIVGMAKTDGYNIAMKEYVWGSNMVVLNNAMLLIAANEVAPDKDYIKYAETHFDYIFGANPMSVCYLTGFGTAPSLHPHHRPSIVKGKAMPGMVIGGPDERLEDPFAQVALEGEAPAKCYLDNEQSYSTNEVTIYWNSPLLYVMAGLDKC